MKVTIETPPHDCTMQTKGACKACKKWLEYQEMWYFDLEHGFKEIHWKNISVPGQ